MNSPERLDELKLQRLVDRELPEEQIRELIQELDRHPQCWREVALAFVEDQLWSDVARRPENDNARSGRPCQAAPEPRVGLSLGAVALGLLMMLVAGICIGHYVPWATRGSIEPVAGQHAAPRTVQEVDERRIPRTGASQADQKPRYRLRLARIDGDTREMLELPVFEESQVDLSARAPARSFESLNRRLEAVGYRVAPRTEYLMGQMDDGRQLLLPLRTVSVQSHGQ